MTYLAIIDYLEREWSEKEIISFISLVHNKLNLLKEQPAIGWVHKKKFKIYKTLVHKNVALIYHVKLQIKEIVLLTFWDDIQDPEKLKY